MRIETTCMLLMNTALTFAFGHAGCRDPCTDKGCEDHFAIAFEPRKPWPPGDYVVTLTYGENVKTCEVTAPVVDSSFDRERCDHRVFGRAYPAVELVFHRVSVVLSNNRPRQATLQVVRDGTLLLEQSFDLNYKRIFPNGEHCGPGCDVASATMDVSSLGSL